MYWWQNSIVENRGHVSANRIAPKVLQSGFYWSTLFKDAKRYVSSCDRCQHTDNISQRYEMPLQNILVCAILLCLGINFVGSFPKSSSHEYILVVVDYIFKWVEVIATRTNDAKLVI